MGIDLLDVGPVFARQAHDAVFDVQFVFADDGGTALPQQFIVVEQTARNGVLDGHQCQAVVVFFHGGKEVFKGVTPHHFEFLALKILMGGNIVKRPPYALNCYFHTVCFNKKSRSFTEAGL